MYAIKSLTLVGHLKVHLEHASYWLSETEKNFSLQAPKSENMVGKKLIVDLFTKGKWLRPLYQKCVQL